MAKKDRKNTASPAGMCGAADLMQIAMKVKTVTERTFRPMPRSGFMGASTRSFGAVPPRADNGGLGGGLQPLLVRHLVGEGREPVGVLGERQRGAGVADRLFGQRAGAAGVGLGSGDGENPEGLLQSHPDLEDARRVAQERPEGILEEVGGVHARHDDAVRGRRLVGRGHVAGPEGEETLLGGDDADGGAGIVHPGREGARADLRKHRQAVARILGEGALGPMAKALRIAAMSSAPVSQLVRAIACIGFARAPGRASTAIWPPPSAAIRCSAWVSMCCT